MSGGRGVVGAVGVDGAAGLAGRAAGTKRRAMLGRWSCVVVVFGGGRLAPSCSSQLAGSGSRGRGHALGRGRRLACTCTEHTAPLCSPRVTPAAGSVGGGGLDPRARLVLDVLGERTVCRVGRVLQVSLEEELGLLGRHLERDDTLKQPAGGARVAAVPELHVEVDGPDVEPLREGSEHAVEDGPAALGRPVTELELPVL
eukprot:scaffold23831_cov194-Isochrysis_galbana.AAC.2